jgi:hypothetical protein
MDIGEIKVSWARIVWGFFLASVCIDHVMTLGCVISNSSNLLICYCRRCARKSKEISTLNIEEMMLMDILRDVF